MNIMSISHIHIMDILHSYLKRKNPPVFVYVLCYCFDWYHYDFGYTTKINETISLWDKNELWLVEYKMCLEILYLIYMYKTYLVSNDLQGLIYFKNKPNQTNLVWDT